MEKIELFQKVKHDFEDLTYDNYNKLDRLNRQLTMLIKNIHGSNSSYLDELMSISYIPISFNSSKDEDIEYWQSGKNSAINLIDTIIEELELFSNSNSSNLTENQVFDNTKIFIVHGHDNEAKTEVARFIERLGLEARILHEQTNSGATIIEKLEKYTDVGFAIILYTPDDIGTVKSDLDNLNPRARQNVVFEHGLLIGKIGRNNVVALVKDTVEIPNDISGVVYETMDSKGAWKYQVAKELKASGYTIDMNAI